MIAVTLYALTIVVTNRCRCKCKHCSVSPACIDCDVCFKNVTHYTAYVFSDTLSAATAHMLGDKWLDWLPKSIFVIDFQF